MKQQDAFKILAAFMILIMVGAPLYLLFEGQGSRTGPDTVEPPYEQEKYDPDLWNLLPPSPFSSISDALNMTPVGAESASYVDLESMTPQMIQWTRMELPLIDEVDSIYNSNTTKMYYATLKYDNNNSFLLLSTMFPEKNDFEYIVYPNSGVLIRQEPGIYGMYNVMGTPVIFAPPKTAIDVIDIITSLNRTATSYDQYEGLLNKVDPAPFQTLSSNVSFAKQFYMGIKMTNGSYERTTAYLNVNSSTLEKLNQSKTNSTQKGFAQYNLTGSGNYTIVKIVSLDLSKLLAEETS